MNAANQQHRPIPDKKILKQQRDGETFSSFIDVQEKFSPSRFSLQLILYKAFRLFSRRFFICLLLAILVINRFSNGINILGEVNPQHRHAVNHHIIK